MTNSDKIMQTSSRVLKTWTVKRSGLTFWEHPLYNLISVLNCTELY